MSTTTVTPLRSASLLKRPAVVARSFSRKVEQPKSVDPAVQEESVESQEQVQVAKPKLNVVARGFAFKPTAAKPKATRKKDENSPMVEAFLTIRDKKLVPEQLKRLCKKLDMRPELLGALEELQELTNECAEETTTKQAPITISPKLLEFLLGTEDEDCPVGNQKKMVEITEGKKKIRTPHDSGIPLRDLEYLSQGNMTKETLTALFYIYYETHGLTHKGPGSNAPRVRADDRMQEYFGDIFAKITEDEQAAIDSGKDKKSKAAFNSADFAINRNYYSTDIGEDGKLSAGMINVWNENMRNSEEGQAALPGIKEEAQIVQKTKKAISEQKKNQK